MRRRKASAFAILAHGTAEKLRSFPGQLWRSKYEVAYSFATHVPVGSTIKGSAPPIWGEHACSRIRNRHVRDKHQAYRDHERRIAI